MSRQEYPHKLDHVLLSDGDALPPRTLHPIFFGSFDWHSCVHGWWTLLTSGGCFPDLPEASKLRPWRTTASRPKRSRRSWRISTGPNRRVRAALWLGLAAGPAPGSQPASRSRLGRRPRAARPGLRRAAQTLSRDPDLPDPRRHAFQHCLRADSRAGMGGGVRRAARAHHRRSRAATGSARIATARPGSRAATTSCRRR